MTQENPTSPDPAEAKKSEAVPVAPTEAKVTETTQTVVEPSATGQETAEQ